MVWTTHWSATRNCLRLSIPKGEYPTTAVSATGKAGDSACAERAGNIVLRAILSAARGDQLAKIVDAYGHERLLEEAGNFMDYAPAISRSAQGIEGRFDLSSAQITRIRDLTARFQEGAAAARQILHVLNRQRPSMPARFASAVGNFKAAILKPDGSHLDGHISAYLAEPVNRSQRVSTVASAVEAFEFGLALAAQAPSSGLGGNGSLAASRAAVGKLQARENAPLVVGFSGPDQKSGDKPFPGGCLVRAWSLTRRRKRSILNNFWGPRM